LKCNAVALPRRGCTAIDERWRPSCAEAEAPRRRVRPRLGTSRRSSAGLSPASQVPPARCADGNRIDRWRKHRRPAGTSCGPSRREAPRIRQRTSRSIPAPQRASLLPWTCLASSLKVRRTCPHSAGQSEENSVVAATGAILGTLSGHFKLRQVSCVYRKPKPGRSGDGVRPVWETM
jgi:hypothetical protein